MNKLFRALSFVIELTRSKREEAYRSIFKEEDKINGAIYPKWHAELLKKERNG